MVALVMELVNDISISVLFLVLSNETGQTDEEARRGRKGAGQSKINRAKQTWRGISSVAPRNSLSHTRAKERKKMTVLRMEALNEA